MRPGSKETKWMWDDGYESDFEREKRNPELRYLRQVKESIDENTKKLEANLAVVAYNQGTMQKAHSSDLIFLCLASLGVLSIFLLIIAVLLGVHVIHHW